ncbi:hypothetical protein ACLM5J_13365 [Nocardioides sp. Bht2]|uniref:hypothetical protein n=1 Tax=Nocardioides sp. Bht2 TaxID=3392297 RepID=UPI0039B41B32
MTRNEADRGLMVDDAVRDDEGVRDDEPVPGKETAGDGGAPTSSTWLPGWAPWGLLAVSLVVLVLGVMFWRDAEPDPDAARAERRDAVIVAASNNLAVLQTMDYQKVDEHLAAWEAATTGVLGDQFADQADEKRQTLIDSQAVSVGKVLSVAVTELGEDTATVIASIITEVRDSSAEGGAVEKRNRFAADLVRVDGKWLVENLNTVGVNLK